MSTTTIKAIYPGEKAGDIEELGNAWGSAPVIWDALGKKYVPGYSMFNQSAVQQLWGLAKDTSIPDHIRAALAMTFDRTYVVKADFARAAADLRKFIDEFPADPGRVNHWPRIAEIFDSDPDVPAIGFYMTSVSEDPFIGDYDEDLDDYKPFDWSRAWSMYEWLDSHKQIAAE